MNVWKRASNKNQFQQKAKQTAGPNGILNTTKRHLGRVIRQPGAVKGRG